MDEAGLGCKTRCGPIFLHPQQDVFLVFEEGVDNILGAWFSGEPAGEEGEDTSTNHHLAIHRNRSGDGLILYTPLSPILS